LVSLHQQQHELNNPHYGRSQFIGNVVAIFTGGPVVLSTSGGPARAEEIKTLNLSLPTYDAISTVKTNNQKETAMGVETPTAGQGTPTKKKNEGILPSMNKSVATRGD
jgi:hypothetical protein